MTDGPLFELRERRRAGLLTPDTAQELAAEKLQSLHNALRNYRPSFGRKTWKDRLGLSRRKADPPQGLYLFGGVGRGKSMMMDLFFDTAPVASKQRVHFHAFMIQVHNRLHVWRNRTKGTESDPLPELAGELAAEASLLCFDEFHVVNIADAMILSRLFGRLFDLGVVVVATSNFPPDRLYEGGLQRENFLPFIALLKERLDVLALDGGRDYRRARLKEMAVYHTPLGPEAEAALDDAFARLTEGAEVAPVRLEVKGRSLELPAAARGVARSDFAALCEAPLGAEDYLGLAQRFHTLVLAGVPRLGKERRDAARRFMTLIDALYEHRTKLVLSAEAPAEALYPDGPDAFEFERTVSRLSEMRSLDYISDTARDWPA